VKSPRCVRLGPVALQILSYLSRHPDAQDTVEGIAEWWMLEQRIRLVINEVKKALAELVGQGMLIERTGSDRRVHYRLNPRKKGTITCHLAGSSSKPTAAHPHALPVNSTVEVAKGEGREA
jgi:hypothetical protein